MSNEADVPADHLLPGPEPNAGQDAGTIEVGEKKAFMFDELGPMVVNRDGTLSRIANWPNMTPLERKRTMRVLIERNQIRIANQKEKQQQSGSESGEPLSISEQP